MEMSFSLDFYTVIFLFFLATSDFLSLFLLSSFSGRERERKEKEREREKERELDEQTRRVMGRKDQIRHLKDTKRILGNFVLYLSVCIMIQYQCVTWAEKRVLLSVFLFSFGSSVPHQKRSKRRDSSH